MGSKNVSSELALPGVRLRLARSTPPMNDTYILKMSDYTISLITT